MMMYFLNLIANIADAAEFPKHITPFGHWKGAVIIANDKPSLIYAKKKIFSLKKCYRHYTMCDAGSFFQFNIFTMNHYEIWN